MAQIFKKTKNCIAQTQLRQCLYQKNTDAVVQKDVLPCSGKWKPFKRSMYMRSLHDTQNVRIECVITRNRTGNTEQKTIEES